MPQRTPTNYESYSLRELHKYIETLGRDHFAPKTTDGKSQPSEIMNYFRVLMIIG